MSREASAADRSKRERVIAMYQRGMSAPDIALEFGTRQSAVRAMLQRAGVWVRPERPRKLRYVSRIAPKTLAQMDHLADLMAEGCPSVSEGGRRLGLAQNRADQLWSMICGRLGEQAQ